MNSLSSANLIGVAPKPLNQVPNKLRIKHDNIGTEQSYVDWIKRFIRHFGKRRRRHEQPKISFRFIAMRSMPAAPQDQARQVAAAYVHIQSR